MSRFDNIVSLGAWCQVSYQIKRRYGIKTNSPFDWIVTPWAGMVAILRDGTEKFARQLVFKADASSAKCLEYKILIPHDLPLLPDKRIVYSAESILDARSKYQYKFRALIEAVSRPGSRNLFIRMGGIVEAPFAWPYLFDAGQLNNQNIEDLVK